MELICDQCGATIDEADAADAGWFQYYYIDGVLIEAPVCDICRRYFVELNEVGRTEFVEGEKYA